MPNDAALATPAREAVAADAAGSEGPTVWPWEERVQAVFAGFLTNHDWQVTSAADTATKAHGVDLLARKRSDCSGRRSRDGRPRAMPTPSG